jgi:hypothetical protein
LTDCLDLPEAFLGMWDGDLGQRYARLIEKAQVMFALTLIDSLTNSFVYIISLEPPFPLWRSTKVRQ